MNNIPKEIYLSAQVRELDRIAIEEFKVPSFTLMQRAGEATFKVILELWPKLQHIIVLAGPGNNGGDGYVIAELARSANVQVEIVQVGDHSKLKGDAKQARDKYVETGGIYNQYLQQPLHNCDLIVDALLGTGLIRLVEGDFKSIIEFANSHSAPVISADIPSGLNANNGVPLGEAIIADVTVSFVGMKLGLLTGSGRRFSGKVYFSDLQIPKKVYQSMTITCNNIVLADLYNKLGERNADAHKGDFGHTLLIGGNQGYTGSVMLAAEAAARTGCGLISVATHPSNITSAAQMCREVMVHAVASVKELDDLLKRVDVVAIGPGLDQDQWARELMSRVLEFNLPMVVDADALNLLAQEPIQKNNWVLTPHPGEAARLIQSAPKEIQQNRLESIKKLQQQYGGVCILKGSGTLIASKDEVSICTAGNPGMASGGMGDVLTGIIAGLLSQGLNLYDAAKFGVQLHAQSADIAANDGMRGMLASDLFAPLRLLVNSQCN